MMDKAALFGLLAAFLTNVCSGLDIEINTLYNPLRILKGSHLELSCVYTGNDLRGALNFFFDNDDTRLDKNFTFIKTIKAVKDRISVEDGGVYRCRHSMINIAFSTTVQVIEVQAPNQTYNDSGIELGCHPKFHPKTNNDLFELNWYKDGYPLQSSSRYNTDDTQLLIHNPDKELDIGQYNCTFTFSKGTAQEQSISVTTFITDDYENYTINTGTIIHTKVELVFVFVMVVAVLIQFTLHVEAF